MRTKRSEHNVRVVFGAVYVCFTEQTLECVLILRILTIVKTAASNVLVSYALVSALVRRCDGGLFVVNVGRNFVWILYKIIQRVL